MAKEKNKGKIFEDDFKKSVPTDCVCHRLKDSPLTYIKCDSAAYTHDNPCDFFVFDGSHGKLFTLELKSTKSLAFTVQMSDDEPKKMIKYHQIKSLTELSEYPNVVSGFLFNFRDEKENTEECYFMFITDFNAMMIDIDKKSCNKTDIIEHGAIPVEGELLRTHYRWDIKELFYYCSYINV